MAVVWNKDADDEVRRLGNDASDAAWCFASRAACLGHDWPDVAIQAVPLDAWRRWTELNVVEANNLAPLCRLRWKRWQDDRGEA